jgi:hypothetical protein
MAAIVTELRELHVIPILFTLPPRFDREAADDHVTAYNDALYGLARARHLLVINLWRALEGSGMIDHGIWRDGIHPNTAGEANLNPSLCIPDCRPFAFGGGALRYGYNRRNLIALRTLNRLRTHVVR